MFADRLSKGKPLDFSQARRPWSVFARCTAFGLAFVARAVATCVKKHFDGCGRGLSAVAKLFTYLLPLA